MDSNEKGRLRSLVTQIRETAESMRSTGAKMVHECGIFTETALHGREIFGAANIALEWADRIEQETDLIDEPESAGSNGRKWRAVLLDDKASAVYPHVSSSMACSSGSVGEQVVKFIAESQLFSVECPDSPNSGCLIVWSANAAEQIESFLADVPCVRTVPCPSCGGQSQ
jgi:hypothetical protein